MPTPPSGRTRTQIRAAYARTNADLTVNSPDGFPSAFPPVWWIGSDQLHLKGSWNHGGWNMLQGWNVPVQPAVTRLTGIITDPLASVPWKQVEQTFGGDVLTTPRWISDPQLLRSDSRYDAPVLPSVQRLPRAEFWASWIRTAIWHGQAGLLFTEDVDGQPTAGSLRTIHPQFLEPVRDESGTLVWEIGDGDDKLRADRDGYLRVGAVTWRLIVLRDPHAPITVDGRSVSIFEQHAESFGLAGEIGSYMSSVYRGNGVPNGILRSLAPGLTQETADALKSAWMRAHGDARSIAVLNSTTEFTPLSRSPVDTALMEGKRASMADMCLAFSLDPAGALGISLGNSATYANVQQYFARLKTDLLPWITAVEEVVSSLLPSGRGIRMDFSEFTRPDPAEQYAALQTAVDAGLLTINEARNILGLAALPEPQPEPEPAPPPPAVQLEEVPEPEPEPVRALRTPAWRR